MVQHAAAGEWQVLLRQGATEAGAAARRDDEGEVRGHRPEPNCEAAIRLLAEHLVGPFHQRHQIGRRDETGILAGEVGVADRTGP
jgi:HAMP domain-containing protein